MKDYVALGTSIGQLVQSKQKAYGDSFGKSGEILRILYPEGISLEKLDDALTIVRVIDKLFRIATDRDALGESPWRDIAGYALLSLARLEKSSETKLNPLNPACVVCGKPALGLWTSTDGVFSKTSCNSDVCHAAMREMHGEKRI